MGKQPAAEVRGAFFFLAVRETGKGLASNHFLCTKLCQHSEGPDFVPLLTALSRSSCWDS